MTIGERIAMIIENKGAKKIEFAAALNIHQSYVSKLVKGESLPSERLIEDICRKFGVNRDWLEHGEGEMLVIEQLAAEYRLDGKARRLVENFLSLSPENREMVIKAFENAVALMTKTPDSEKTPEEMHAELTAEIAARDAARKKDLTTSLASTITSGSKEKFGIKS